MEYRVVDGLKEELRIKRQTYDLKYVSCIFQWNWLNFQCFHSNEVLLQSLCLKHDLKKFKTIMVNGYQWPSHDNGKWGAQSYFNYAGRGTLSFKLIFNYNTGLHLWLQKSEYFMLYSLPSHRLSHETWQ